MSRSFDLAFSWFQPTRVTFGVGVLAELALECRRCQMERVVLVTDRFLHEETDLIVRAKRALGKTLVGIYDGVTPDTGVSVIDTGAALARAHQATGLVSLGGGSAIDTAKGIAIVLTEGGSIRDHQGSMRLKRPQTPHIAIPTTAGTGSEVSMYIVVKDEVAHEKMHYMEEQIIPSVALLDPTVTVGMPAQLTAATGMDAVTHAIEAYTSLNRSPIADAASLQALRLLRQHLERAVLDGQDLTARGGTLIAANLAGQAFNGTGVGLVHAMAHVVGARYGVHHGTANAICLAAVMRFNNDELAPRYRDIADALGLDVRGLSDAAAGSKAANFIASWVAQLGLPTRLRDVGVPERELEQCAEGSTTDGAIVFNGKFAADKELILQVYRNAY